MMHFSNISGPRDYHTEKSKSDKEREISDDITYIWKLTDLENELMVRGGESDT